MYISINALCSLFIVSDMVSYLAQYRPQSWLQSRQKLSEPGAAAGGIQDQWSLPSD